jgi:hypothetical protein
MIKLVAIFIFIVREIIKSAKDVGVDIEIDKRKEQIQVIVNPLTYSIAGPLTNDKSTFRPVISMKQKQNNKIMLLK